MRYSSFILFLIALFIAPVESVAQDEISPFKRVGEFDERLEELGRVSGDIIMGVMIGPVSANSNTSAILADAAPRLSADLQILALPEAENRPKHICVRINSKDGRFEAANTYELIDGPNPLSAPIPYTGKYGPNVAQMPAVSLIRPGLCGDGGNVVIPSIWAAKPVFLEDGALHLFINSAGNPAYVAFGEKTEDCEDVTDATTLKYTASCVVALSKLVNDASEGAASLSIFVTRSLGEDVFDISVLVPSGLE